MRQTKPPIRFGLVGAGGIAQDYAQVLAGAPSAVVAAVADVRLNVADALGETLRCPGFGSYEEMAESSQMDAVIICTPPATHAEICLYFLERRLHVLCEKPLCLDVPSAVRIVETAYQAGVKFAMASKFRYVQDVVRAKSLVTSGILGEVILLENTFTSRVNMASRWNSMAEISGGGVLVDNGTHSLDLVRYILGPLVEVQAIEGKRTQGLAVDETVRLFTRSADGALASIDLSWSINKNLDSYLNIYGSHGTVSVGWRESKYRQISSPDFIVFGAGYSKHQAMRAEVDNFVGAIRGEEALLITPEDALASVESIEAAYTALRRNQWTPVESRAAAVS